MTIATLLFALIVTTAGEAAGEPLLLDFHASWCGPCQQMRPAIEQLTRKGYPVKSVDIDRSPEMAERYEVTSVPTFIVVDAEGQPLARTSGAQPALELARLYQSARQKMNPPATAAAPVPVPADDDRDVATAEDRPASRPRPTNPKPWETVVRIKVMGQGSIGFGSGTIIYSSPEESIILTCAHIFKLDGRQQATPSRFPRPIKVDLFDGNLSGQQPAMVHYAEETYDGKAIDYDFDRDVGLIRIRPGRKLPYSRVVPTHWKPQERMLMTTVGCSEGRDATAWSTTIVNPAIRGLSGNPQYEAIECGIAPKQGRSGGGLYTSDGYVAGVCDFAEPRGNHGLYATPTSIHHILDKNNLALCYAPVKGPSSSQALLASNDRPSPGRRSANANAPATTRLQSPDRDESNLVMIPPPELLGIKSPAGEVPIRSASNSNGSRKANAAGGWQPTPERTDLTLGPEFDSDRFATGADEALPRVRTPGNIDVDESLPAPKPTPTRAPSSKSSGKWRPSRSPLPSVSTTR